MGPAVRTVISPSRYVQGKGAISELGTYLKQIGSAPLMVADDLRSARTPSSQRRYPIRRITSPGYAIG